MNLHKVFSSSPLHPSITCSTCFVAKGGDNEGPGAYYKMLTVLVVTKF